MPRRILFADDSMTAQNMGKKILTEAGYEVIAVSNGAAAVKKIAEHKPDMIILDIFMPGYSGLEVCEKVRASFETMKTPVLLTVGKMEPYSPGDANRVKADGVIVKPFEASDLLAIIRKFEERIAPQAAAPGAEQTIRLERPPDSRGEFAVAPAPPPPPPLPRVAEASMAPPKPPAEVNLDQGENTVQATVDVPDHMATSSAFSDLLGPEPEPSLEQFSVPAPPVVSRSAPVSISPAPAAQVMVEIAPSLEETPELDSAAGFTVIPEFESSAPSRSASPEPRRAAAPAFSGASFETSPEASREASPETFSGASPETAESEYSSTFGALPEILVLETMAPEKTMVPEAMPHPGPPAEFTTSPAGLEMTPRPRTARDTQPIPIYQAPEAPAEPEVTTEPEAAGMAFESRPQTAAEENFHAIPLNREAEPATYELERASTSGVEGISLVRDPAFEPPMLETAPDVAAAGDPELQSGFQYASQELKPAAPAAMDPNLVTGPDSLDAFTTKFGAENPEEMPVGIISELPEFEEHDVMRAEDSPASGPGSLMAETEASVSEDDFEARVAAAMAAYEQSAEADTGSLHESSEEIAPEASVLEARAPEPEILLVEEPGSIESFEYIPPVDGPRPASSMPEAEPAHQTFEPPAPDRSQIAFAEAIPASIDFPAAVDSQAGSPEAHLGAVHSNAMRLEATVAERERKSTLDIVDIEAQDEQQETGAGYRGPVAATSNRTGPDMAPESAPLNARDRIALSIESELPVVVAATASATRTEGERIAQVVHRVMERLKPELIAEIVRELNSTE